MSLPCKTCGPPVDCPPDDPFLFNLTGEPVLPFVLNCPPGFACNQSSITLVCCGHNIVRDIQNQTPAQLSNTIGGMLAECSQYQAQCADAPVTPGGPPTTPLQLFFNGPATASVDCPDGVSTFSWTVPGGSYFGFTQAMADGFAIGNAARLARYHRCCLSKANPDDLCLGVNTTVTIQATGNTLGDDNSFELVDGAVPTGMTFNGGVFTSDTSCTITGTPSVAGEFDFTIKLTTSGGDTMTKRFILCVVEITCVPAGTNSTSLPDASLGQSYTVTLNAPGCTGEPIVWEIDNSGDNLPTGLTLDPDTGVISGTPTQSGNFNIFVRIKTEVEP